MESHPCTRAKMANCGDFLSDVHTECCYTIIPEKNNAVTRFAICLPHSNVKVWETKIAAQKLQSARNVEVPSVNRMINLLKDPQSTDADEEKSDDFILTGNRITSVINKSDDKDALNASCALAEYNVAGKETVDKGKYSLHDHNNHKGENTLMNIVGVNYENAEKPAIVCDGKFLTDLFCSDLNDNHTDEVVIHEKSLITKDHDCILTMKRNKCMRVGDLDFDEDGDIIVKRLRSSETSEGTEFVAYYDIVNRMSEIGSVVDQCHVVTTNPHSMDSIISADNLTTNMTKEHVCDVDSDLIVDKSKAFVIEPDNNSNDRIIFSDMISKTGEEKLLNECIKCFSRNDINVIDKETCENICMSANNCHTININESVRNAKCVTGKSNVDSIGQMCYDIVCTCNTKSNMDNVKDTSEDLHEVEDSAHRKIGVKNIHDAVKGTFNSEAEEGLLMCTRFYLNIKHSLATDLNSVGEQVWHGALILCDYIISHAEDFLGKCVTDLGAGVGLTSIIAAMFARKIYCTDTGEQILQYAADNIHAAKQCPTLPLPVGDVKIRNLNWFKGFDACATGDIYELNDFDVASIKASDILLAADVVYDLDITDAFFKIVHEILSHPPNKILYIALEKRLVFTLSDLDVTSPCYNHFIEHLDSFSEKGNNPNLHFTVKLVDLSFLQYFEYMRIKHLEIWSIESCHSANL